MCLLYRKQMFYILFIIAQSLTLYFPLNVYREKNPVYTLINLRIYAESIYVIH